MSTPVTQVVRGTSRSLISHMSSEAERPLPRPPAVKLLLSATLVRTAADFAGIWPQLTALRQHCLVEDDVLLDPVHFLATISSERRSCSVACWAQKHLIGFVYATEHYAKGIKTGYAIGGDFSGRGLIVCDPERENEVLKLAAELMLSRGIHSLHLRMAPRTTERPLFQQLTAKYLAGLIPGDRLEFASTYEAFLATLGKHTRRNIRYYSRKATEAGLTFEPSIPDADFRAARDALNRKTLFPLEPAHHERDDRLLALHNGGLRMGLCATDGSMAAMLCGFVRDRRFHLLTQWNDPAMAQLSLSLILRGYAVEHLISLGLNELHFMGGTSLSFGRFCLPHQYCSILLDRKTGPTPIAKKLLAFYCLKRAQSGKPISSAVESLSGGYLADSRLELRTALNPASVAFAPEGTKKETTGPQPLTTKP